MEWLKFDPNKKVEEVQPSPLKTPEQVAAEPKAKNTDPYYDQFSRLIEDVEGRKHGVYNDTKGIPTVGIGYNLNDQQIRGVMDLNNINADEIISGSRNLTDEEIDNIKAGYHKVREPLISNRVGSDLFDTLTPNQKAAVASMGYQSLNNIGPNLRSRLADNDTIGAMREIILNTNKDKDPGILSRRLKEASVFGGDEFPLTFQTFNDAEKKEVLDMINSIGNENTKAEIMKQYQQYLVPSRRKRFQNLAGD